LVPFLHARATTPQGWTFTGNLTVSPDHMQYRVLARQAREGGPIVDNRFTPEANRPHLLVLLYYLIGKLSAMTGLTTDVVYAWAGVPLAFALTIVVFGTVRQFLPVPNQTWWVTLVIMLSGGLGAHLKALESIGAVRDSALLRRLWLEPLWNQVVFEEHRGNYVVIALFDTHFIAIWLASTSALLAFYAAVRQYSWARLLIAAALFGIATLLHVYEGVTLLAILAAVLALCWWKDQARRTVAVTCAACAIAAGVCGAAQLVLFRASGLPMPDWRGPAVLFSTLVIAYPIGWLLLVTAGSRFWSQWDLDRCVLVGWLAGCTALTLSAPFYPYPNRGTMTLMVPLYILAGLAYFSRRSRVSLPAACLVLATLGVTPVWMVQHAWRHSSFSASAPHKFLSPAHRATIDALVARASETDLLLADEQELLWLAPEYPGRHYCGHFFLTVDYQRRRAEVARFFAAGPLDQAAFLAERRVRFLFVAERQRPDRFSGVPGLRLAAATGAGSLFEFER
jgi:hypothetical protein